MMRRLCLAVLAATLPFSAIASDRYIRTDELMASATQVFTQIGRQLGSPVESPAVLPKQPSHLYAYAEVDIKTGNYTIFMDSQPDCKGAHYCNVGSLKMSKGQEPVPLRDRNGIDITVKVRLSDGRVAYVTPGHSMGDYWPAEIQWTRNGVLYELSWNGAFPEGEQRTLVTLANSVGSTRSTGSRSAHGAD
jgi:hypothetical protein